MKNTTKSYLVLAGIIVGALIGGVIYWDLPQSFGTAPRSLLVSQGGTGSTTLTGILKGNGTNAIQTAVSGVDYGSGTVTSVAMTAPTGLTISGSPITTSGTLALTTTSGYVIATTTRANEWDTAYTNRITSVTYPLGISSNVLSVAYGTTTSNTWAGTQTFTNNIAGSITGLAGTASALASDPTDCSANTWATGIAASGNLTCGAVTYAGITAMTSANFAGLISDEVGTGKVLFDTSPTLVTPILGYASSTQLTVSSTLYLGTATTTGANGFNISAGCYAIGGTCLTAGGSGTVGTGVTGQFPYYAANGTTLTATSSLLINSAGKLTIGTTTSNNFWDLGTTYSAIIDTKDATTNGLILLNNRNSTTIRSNNAGLFLVNENTTTNNMNEIYFATLDTGTPASIRTIAGISAIYTSHQNAAPAGGLRFWTRSTDFVDALSIAANGSITTSGTISAGTTVTGTAINATLSTATSTLSSGVSILSAIEFYTNKVIKLLTGGIFDTTAGTTHLGTTDILDGSTTAKVSAFQYPSMLFASSTPMTGTSTFEIRTAPVAETWVSVICNTDVGTANVQFYNGLSQMTMVSVTATPATTTLATNNAVAAGAKITADVGTPASSPLQVQCSLKKFYTP